MTFVNANESRHGLLVRLCLPILFATLAACGGGGSDAPAVAEPPVQAASCDPDDPATADECGVLFLAMTDADGDFLSYSVDVVSLTLVRRNGDTVQTLPNATRVDFTDYVELTEFVSARNLPPGDYVSGTITLDYGDAEILIEKDGMAEAAVVTDADGNPLTSVSLSISLDSDTPVRITRGRTALLVVDFDLAATHTVDLDATPISAIAEPVIVADIQPIDEKDLRVRGPLAAVDVDASTYDVRLRPFFRRDGDFGGVTVNVDDNTIYEVDGEALMGTAGLQAMAALAAGSPTRAIGTLDVDAREFTASEVLAGSSVPGVDADAVRGHVIARSGNVLTVIGATILRDEREAYFNDSVSVTISDATKVFGADGEQSIDAISVGQKIWVRGVSVPGTQGQLSVDASEGSVRLLKTRISGLVVQANAGQLDVDLVSIGGRRPSLFDFAGTGSSIDTDADPDNYEIATGPFDLNDFTAGAPAVAYGKPNVFGFAPPDFVGRTLIDIDEIRASLGIGWTMEGSTAPFLSISADGIVPDPAAFADDARQFIKIGPRLVPLADVEGGITITGSDARRTLYGIRDGNTLQLYREFADFADAIASTLDGATAARSLSASGSYASDTQTFAATSLYLNLVRD